MDTRQVEYAVAVAEELSFTRAAARVFAVQSTVSAGVRALEADLGIELFERDRRGVRLSAAGEQVLPALRDLLAAQDRVRTAADAEGSLRGLLRIGIFANLGYLDFPRVIGDFHAAHPLVDMRLRPSATGSAGLAEDVRRGRLDIALFGLPASAAPGLDVHPLAVASFVAVLPRDHRLAGRREIDIDDIIDERFVDTPQGYGNRAMLDAALAARGAVRDVATEVGEVGSIPHCVAAGLGVALLPDLLVQQADETAVVPLRAAIPWELNAITRPAAAPVVRAFLDRLRSA